MGLRDRLPDPVILQYYLYMATTSAGLSVPIWVVFLRSHGLSYTEAMVLDAIWWLVLAPVGVGLLLAGVAVAPLLAFPAFFAFRAAKTATQPMANQYVNDRVGTAGRATVLSATSMVYSLVSIPFAVAAGVLADANLPLASGPAAGPLGAMTVAGVVLVALATAVWLVRTPPIGADSRAAVDVD